MQFVNCIWNEVQIAEYIKIVEIRRPMRLSGKIAIYMLIVEFK